MRVLKGSLLLATAVFMVVSCTGGNGSSGPPGCVNLVDDSSFEWGRSGGAWTEYSLNFVTPVGDVVDFGSTGGGSGPRTGTYWAWFGGIDAYEVASVAQLLELPPGADTLLFYLEIPACAVSGVDTFRVEMDGIDIFLTDNYDPICDSLGYQGVLIDLTGFDDGGLHSLVFKGEVFGEGPSGSEITNFFIDDIQIEYCGL